MMLYRMSRSEKFDSSIFVFEAAEIILKFLDPGNTDSNWYSEDLETY